jgi:hypothetical protein
MLIRLEDNSELLVRRAVPGNPVTALAWDAKGQNIAFGCRDGTAGILSLAG